MVTEGTNCRYNVKNVRTTECEDFINFKSEAIFNSGLVQQKITV